MNVPDRVRAAQIRSIYRNTPPGLVATSIALGGFTIVLANIDAVSVQGAAVLVAIIVAQTVARLLLTRAHGRSVEPDRRWREWGQRFTVGAIVGGLTIGGGVAWVMQTGRVDLQALSLLLVCVFTSGAVVAFAAYLPAFISFFVAASIAPMVWLLAHGGVLYNSLAVMYVIWFFAVTELARRTAASFTESVMLRFENLDLVENLQREKLAAEQANAAKSRFLAAASHDLRQPVHALSLFVAAMRPRTMDEEARELLDHIDDSVRAMSGLFGGLLDISRLDAGVVEVNRGPVAVQPLLERVCHDFEVLANAIGLQLVLHECSLSVMSDALLLERILRNIIANAITYTDRGRVVVGCRRRRGNLSIQVWDTGRGIPAHEQEHVFQEFYQLGNPERDRTKGVGLGLAIVRRLTQLLGHTLTVRSELRKGSMFAVSTPYADEAAAVTAQTGEFSAPFLAHGYGLILVIDDEMAIQIAMKSLLESWGYEAITAGSCDEMLERIATHRTAPRLIISDYRLRDNASGIDAIERLRSEYNDEIPGMLITGDTAADRLKEAQESGFLLLHKPVPNHRLRASIAHLIDSSDKAVA
ncbi:MAG TPA: hybrid sensor histidine kinase/response regulator [Steroidobacteraceae bacterium]|nr:hybrid sensor histidine kinase/response regulator [Steroidobacteraceae bacterium]